MSGCNCGCGGGHEPGCPVYQQLIGTDIGVLGGDGCGPGTGNAPVLSVACSPLAALGPMIDSVRRLKAQLGGTPYRVFLVWERQTADEWVDVRRIELMPVELRNLNELLLEISASGTKFDGEVVLVNISPHQVSQDDLLGMLEGRAWDDEGCRFFYEVVVHKFCAGQMEPTRLRFAPRGHPELRTARAPIGWMVRLTDQSVPRGRHGEDRSVALGEHAEVELDKWRKFRG